MRRRSLNRNTQGLILLALLAALFAVIFLRHKVPSDKSKTPGYSTEVLKPFNFSNDSDIKEWEEKVFKGKVVYRVEKDGGESYVRAQSDKAASALYYKIKMDAKAMAPVVSWKWRADKFPVKVNKESLDTENEDDFAARVYVIFPAMFFTNSKVLEYVWAESLPVGSTGISPYSKNIKLMVLQSGAKKDWACEERDICADYMTMFGCEPEYNIGAVAFMTNAEHTGSSADAVYDEIKLGYRGGGGK